MSTVLGKKRGREDEMPEKGVRPKLSQDPVAALDGGEVSDVSSEAGSLSEPSTPPSTPSLFPAIGEVASPARVDSGFSESSAPRTQFFWPKIELTKIELPNLDPGSVRAPKDLWDGYGDNDAPKGAAADVKIPLGRLDESASSDSEPDSPVNVSELFSGYST